MKRHFTIAMNRNGQKVLQIKPANGRGFSIQTNQNLPTWHQYPVGWKLTPGYDGQGAARRTELIAYIRDHGTPRQKAMFKDQLTA
jgi:hypothetical protein